MEFSLSRVSDEVVERDFDVLIIGAGAGGLSAAVYSVRSGLTALVIDKSVSGGLTAESPLVENYLGYKAIKGADLAKKFTEHALEYVKILENTEVISIKKTDGKIIAMTDKGEFTGKSLVIATGTSHKHLNVPGEKEYFAKGLSYCSTCDGFLFKDKRVVVIGGGNSGAIASISMNEYTSKTTILEFMDHYMCEEAYTKTLQKNNVDYILNAQVLEIVGDGRRVTGIKYKDRNSGEEKVLETDGVFIYVGLVPQTAFLKNSGVELSDRGYVKTDLKGRTSVDGIYSAGDVTQGTEAQIATAVGDGCRVAITNYNDLIRSGRR